MARLVLRDGGIERCALPRMAVARVAAGVLLVAVVGVHRVAGAASRGAVVAGLVAGAQEPQMRVVQARLRDVDRGHRDAAPRARPAVRLADVGAARLVQLLQRSGAVRQPDLRELARNDAPAALEHPETVGPAKPLPPRARRERMAVGLLSA